MVVGSKSLGFVIIYALRSMLFLSPLSLRNAKRKAQLLLFELERSSPKSKHSFDSLNSEVNFCCENVGGEEVD